MHITIPVPPGMHYEAGICPNEGSACYCIGVCRVLLVRDEDCECGGTGKVKRKYNDVTSFTSSVV